MKYHILEYKLRIYLHLVCFLQSVGSDCLLFTSSWVASSNMELSLVWMTSHLNSTRGFTSSHQELRPSPIILGMIWRSAAPRQVTSILSWTDIEGWSLSDQRPLSHLTYVIEDAEWEHFKHDGGLDRKGIRCSLCLLSFHRLESLVLEPHLVVGHNGIEDNLGINCNFNLLQDAYCLPLVSSFQFLVF